MQVHPWGAGRSRSSALSPDPDVGSLARSGYGNSVDVLEPALRSYRQKDFLAAHEVLSRRAADATLQVHVRRKAYDAAAFMLLKQKCTADQLMHFLLDCQPDSSDRGVRRIYDASLALYHGDLGRFWERVDSLPAYDHRSMGPWNRGTSTAPKQERSAALAAKSASVARLETASGGNIRFVFSADGAYFKQFARICVSSYRATGGSE